ncbi:MAG: universal stress protein [Planctomycetes bacterium]|nr:universal stress protein [Planctomycetota bacterium]
MFKKILVPVDFTEKNRAALEQARQLLSEPDGSITLLHVIEAVDGGWDAELAGFYERLQERARDGMKKLLEDLEDQSLQCDSVIAVGNRVAEIVRVAKSHDLVILGSHSVTPGQVGPGWMGVSYRAAILCPCPVLLVK